MKKVKNKSMKKTSPLPRIAYLLGKSSIDSACALWYYQPKVPMTMRKGK